MLLKDLENLLDDVESINEEQMDEKIMTKKQAARKRALRRKRRAEKRAEKKELEKQNIESSDEQEDEKEQEEKQDSPGTALVVYKEVNNQENVTEQTAQIINNIIQLLNTHYMEMVKAWDIWKRVGEDKSCPQEAWEIFNNTIQETKKQIQQLTANIDFDKLPDADFLAYDIILTPLNGYFEKIEKQITAIKPNFGEDDLKAIEDKYGDKEEKKAQAIKDLSSLSGKRQELDNKKRRNNDKLVTYKQALKNDKLLMDSLKNLTEKGAELLNKIKEGATAVWKILAHPIDFIGDKIWGLLTSPLAKDIVKTFMYANPLTAMIFDGDFGSFGIGAAISKLHDKAKEKLRKAQQGDAEDYDDRHFPKTLDRKTLRQLYKYYYGNKPLVDCINVSYNHPKVRIKEKAELKRITGEIDTAFNTKSIERVRKKFNALIDVLDDICDYMNWIRPKDWQNFVTSLVAQGRTDKEQHVIDKKAAGTKTKDKDSSERSKIKNAIADYKSDIQIDKKSLTKDNIKQKLIKKGYDKKAVDKVLNDYTDKDFEYVPKNESYTFTKNLIKLLERAEA